MKNKHDVYKGKDCMKKFCESLREHAIKIINFIKKKRRLLTNRQQELYDNSQICYICEENFEDECIKYKKYCRIRDRCHKTGELQWCCT